MNKLKSYRIGCYEKAVPNSLSFREKFKALKKAGFDFMEMSIDESDEKLARLDYTIEEIKELKNIMLEEDFRIESITFSAQRRYPMGSFKFETQAKEIIDKCIRFASLMGISIIMTQGYDVYYDETSTPETIKKFYETLRYATEKAASHGIILATETMMDCKNMNSVAKVMEGVKMMDSPYYNVYPDIGNIYNSTDDLISDIKSGKGHIIGAHLKETLPGIDRGIPYGQGQVDFPKYIKLFYELGIRRYVAEFWDDGSGNYEQILKHNREFLDKQFELALKEEKC